MNNFASIPADDESPAALTARLMSVVTDLTAIITEENAALAVGMPAGLALTAQRKEDLSEEYEDLCVEMAESGPGCLGSDAVKLHALAQATNSLRSATAENLIRLEAALNASRRRIEAIMDAVRTQHGESAVYGPGGGVPLGARLAAFGKDFHA